MEYNTDYEPGQTTEQLNQQFDEEKLKMDQFARKSPVANMPDWMQIPLLGARDVGHGLQDLYGAANATPWGMNNQDSEGNYYKPKQEDIDAFENARHQERNDFRTGVYGNTGSPGRQDPDMLDEMGEYGIDAVAALATGGWSLPGTALGTGAKALGRRQIRNMAQDKIQDKAYKELAGETLFSPGAKKLAGEAGEDIVNTAASEFLHGKVMTDQDKGIMDSFSPEALAMEVAADVGIMGLFKGAATPGRMARAKRDRASETYKVGANAAEKMFSKYGDDPKAMAATYSTLKQNQHPTVAQGFQERFQALKGGDKSSWFKKKPDAETKKKAQEGKKAADTLGDQKKAEATKAKKNETLLADIENTAGDSNLDSVIKNNREYKWDKGGKHKRQDKKTDPRLDEVFSLSSDLESMDQSKMSPETAAKVNKLIETTNARKAELTKQAESKAAESASKLTDRQLKQTARKDINNKKVDLDSEGGIYARARAKEVEKRKDTEGYKAAKEVEVKEKAQKSTNENISTLDGFKNSSRDEISAEADRLRGTSEYESAIDDILNAQDIHAQSLNKGKAKHKGLTLKEKAEVAKAFGKRKGATNAEKVAASDMYNSSNQAQHKDRQPATAENTKEDLSYETDTETKREPIVLKINKKEPEPKKTETKKEPKSEPIVLKMDKKETKSETKVEPTKEKKKKTKGIRLNINKVTKVEPEQKGTGVNFSIKPTQKLDHARVGESFKGTKKAIPNLVDGNRASYNSETNEITIDLSQRNIGAQLDHEILHALTDAAYDNGYNAPVDKVVDEMRSKLKDTKLSNRDKDFLESIEDNQEFAVTVMTDPRYFEAFDNIDSDSPFKTNVVSLIKKLFGVLSDIAKKIKNDGSLAAELTDVMYAQTQTKVETLNYNTRFHTAMSKPATGIQVAEEFVRDNIVNPVAKKTWNVLNVIYDRVDKDHAFANLIKGSYKGNLFGKVLKDWGVIGNNIHKKIQDFSNDMKKIDDMSLAERGNIAEDIKRLLPNKENIYGLTTTVDEVKLADEIVGLDLQSLKPDDLMKLYDDGFSADAVNTALRNKERNMNSYMSDKGISKDANFNKAVDFLVAQVLGKQKDRSYRLNAVNNVRQLINQYTTNDGVNSDFLNMVDDWITLKAMQKRRPTESLKIERDNFREIAAIHRTSVSMFKKVNGTGPQYRKGYLGGRMDPYWDYEYMPTDVYEKVKGKEGDGWERFGFGDNGRYVHAKRQSAYLAYNKGATPTKQKHAKGGKKHANTNEMLKDLDQSKRNEAESVKDFNERITDAIEAKYGAEYEPFFNTRGEIRGIRSEMADNMKRKELGFDTPISDSIANSILSTNREAGYKRLSNDIEASLVKDVSAKGFKRSDILDNIETDSQYVMLRGETKTIQERVDKHILDKHYAQVTPEIRSILPNNLKDIKYINKMYRDELIGYKNDFWFGSRGAQLIEMYWRDAVQNFKASVIAKNPVAITTNAVGNMVMLMSEGGSLPFIVKEVKRAYDDIEQMGARIKAINRLEVRQESFPKGSAAYKNNIKRIAEMEKELKSSEAFIGMNEGWYQSTLDDFYESRVTQNTPIARQAEKAYRKVLEKAGMDKNKADNMVDMGCNAVLSQNSRSGRQIQKFISGTDYSSRLAMYRLKRSQGMGKAESAALARDSFVDYRALLPKEINALRVNGVIPFATWAYRMQPVLAKQAYNNPIKVAALYGAYASLNDELGYVGDVRVGGWLPGTAFMDPSPIGGLPLEMAQGNVPTEILMPEIYGNLLTGNYDKVLGVNIKD